MGGVKAPSESTSRRMRATGQRDTAPELALRSAVHGRGLRYRVDHRPLPQCRRRADLVFSAARVAVFLDGCFWHCCPEHMTWPVASAAWWRDKIEGNRRRDHETDAILDAAGWVALRVWEHDDPEAAAERIAEQVRGRLAAVP